MILREDGVILVLALDGEAGLAALEEAVGVLVGEIPAAIALARVAAERAHVADLRSADLAGRGREGREETAQVGVSGNLRECHAGANGDGVGADVDGLD